MYIMQKYENVHVK